MTDKQYSLTQLPDQLPYLINLVENGHAVELTCYGQVIAVIVSPQDYHQLKQPPQRTVWEAIQAFRQTLDPTELEPDEDFCKDLRDRSPGREVIWW